MVKFTIVDIGGNKRELPYLMQELRKNNLVAGTEKDAGGDTIYLTHNLVAVKRIVADYEGFMLDVVKER